MTSADDAEQRIADLEKQVADARRIADLERELAEAKARQRAAGFTGGPALNDLASRFGASWSASAGPPAPPADTRLATAPRRIPVSFLLAELLPFRWWYIFAMFLVAVAPIALWIGQPGTVAPAAVATLLLIYGYQFWTARKRLALLRWGRVATVTGTEIVSRATYYSGTTWSNVWLPQARGWTVKRELWSGRNTKTRVHYTLDGYQGELKVSGREYLDGVILADQRRPERALCVSSFAYDLDRDDTGNWVGRLRPRLLVGMLVWMVVVIGWLAAAVGISTGIANEVFATRLAPGGTGSVSGDTTVYCNDGHLTTDGIDYHVTVRGHCATLQVNGIDGVVIVDSVDSVTLSGIDNSVVYHSGTPKVDKDSMSGSVSKG